MRKRIPAHCEILAVVKADAYGHGAAAVVPALEKHGVGRFGVATLQEGLNLRESGCRSAIVVLGAWFPDHAADLVAHRLTPIIYETRLAQALARAAPRDAPYPVHLKVDTGMGRLGMSPEEALALLDSPAFQSTLRAEGLVTHLADADNEDPGYTATQLQTFDGLIRRIEAAGYRIPLRHASNSAGILYHPSAHFNVVRPGIMLYGYEAAGPPRPSAGLQPVLSLTATVAQVRAFPAGQRVSYSGLFTTTRPSRIAVLSIGYADGYDRKLTGRAFALINGRRAPVVGRICMDMTMVDVTDVPEVQAGDQAVLIGEQGAEHISAADVAAWLETIPYEVLCGIGPRVPRVYR